MKYPGSKNRIAKELWLVMFKYFKDRYVWIEPFVGGANMIDKIPHNYMRYGFDNNKYIISMFFEIQRGWIPPSYISEDEYMNIKNNKEKYPDELVGFVGVGCSFAGKWFGGYARGGTRNYCLESKKNVLRQKNNIQTVNFNCVDFTDITPEWPSKTIIYCDPPYQNTTKYKSNFNHNEFWEWAENQQKNGSLVFVSEYNAPENWECIWQKEIVSSLDLNTGNKKGIEKLFILGV